MGFFLKFISSVGRIVLKQFRHDSGSLNARKLKDKKCSREIQREIHNVRRWFYCGSPARMGADRGRSLLQAHQFGLLQWMPFFSRHSQIYGPIRNQWRSRNSEEMARSNNQRRSSHTIQQIGDHYFCHLRTKFSNITGLHQLQRQWLPRQPRIRSVWPSDQGHGCRDENSKRVSPGKFLLLLSEKGL